MTSCTLPPVTEIPLKYGCNPNQGHARVVQPAGKSPLRVVNGAPSYINMLDGLRGWQLVRELAAATGRAAAASYKHVSPAGAAVAGPVDEAFCRAFFYDLAPAEFSPVAAAYARARSSDRVASFGDFIAVSEPVDDALAAVIKPEVSDGIIAPGYTPSALATLRAKKGGRYVMFEIDPTYEPAALESRCEFGLTLEQDRNEATVGPETFGNIVTQAREIPASVMETLVVTTLTLKHTQSNSIAVGRDGHAIGIGAGQQSRIACTRIACDKADRWLLKTHPRALELRYADHLGKAERNNALDMYVRYHELMESERAELKKALVGAVEPIDEASRVAWLRQQSGVVLSSDAFIPFRDNLDRAAASGVKAVAQAGGSARDCAVIEAADEYGMVMAMTGLRLFLH